MVNLRDFCPLGMTEAKGAKIATQLSAQADGGRTVAEPGGDFAHGEGIVELNGEQLGQGIGQAAQLHSSLQCLVGLQALIGDPPPAFEIVEQGVYAAALGELQTMDSALNLSQCLNFSESMDNHR